MFTGTIVKFRFLLFLFSTLFISYDVECKVCTCVNIRVVSPRKGKI